MADFMESSVVGYEEKLGVIIDGQKLEVIWGPENIRDCKVKSSDVNRPGLALNGFFDCLMQTEFNCWEMLSLPF